MTSPMLTVVVLAVLWLIVVVPMVVRRRDELAGPRSVRRFSSAMGALSRRSVADAPASPLENQRTHPTVHVSGATSRRPVPAAKESLMYPPDRHDMSEARCKMMARRRRSLITLGAGTLMSALAVFATGSTVAMILTALFAVGLVGYLFFLRSQALRDAHRREVRLQRATVRPLAELDVVDEPVRLHQADNVVRIDEDDLELDHLDTVDLTGLYSEIELQDSRIRRAG
jgi:hypothetical protein